MQIRAHRDSDLQRDRLVQKLEWSRHVTRGRCWGADATACKPSYHVNSLLYTSKNYSGVILGFLITFCVTISFFSVCYIICKINKSQSFFYISFLFKFFKWYITISFSLYYVYQTTNSCPVWGHLFQFWTLSNNCDNPLAKLWTLVQIKESPGGRKAKISLKNELDKRKFISFGLNIWKIIFAMQLTLFYNAIVTFLWPKYN